MAAAEEFDVVVVGAGPAGSSAAYTLAKSGLRTCLVDKSLFPRDKLCGGLLTLRSKRIFEETFSASWEPAIEATARGFGIYHQNRLLNAVDDGQALSFTRRSEFDHLLLRLAVGAGAALRLGAGAAQIDPANRRVRLRDDTLLSGRYLVGADGVNSRVARTLFGAPFDRKRIALGFAAELPIGVAVRVDAPEIHWGAASWGYGWVFPKKGRLTAGIGGLRARNADLRARFRQFWEMRFGDLPPGRVRGHFLPFGSYRKRPGREEVLLCGDAAGLVDPITGEGIAFAMQSGRFAAEAIAEALGSRGRQTALERYQERYRTITRSLDAANLLRHLLYAKTAEPLFLRTLPKTQTLLRRHLDLLSGDIGYGEYLRFILGKIAQSTLRF